MKEVWNNCPICDHELARSFGKIYCPNSNGSAVEHYLCYASNDYQIYLEVYWLFPNDDYGYYDFQISRSFEDKITITNWRIENRFSIRVSLDVDITKYIYSKKKLTQLFMLQ